MVENVSLKQISEMIQRIGGRGNWRVLTSDTGALLHFPFRFHKLLFVVHFCWILKGVVYS